MLFWILSLSLIQGLLIFDFVFSFSMGVGELLGLPLSVGNLPAIAFVGNLTGYIFLVGNLTFPHKKLTPAALPGYLLFLHDG